MDACESKVVQMQAAIKLGFDVPELLVSNQSAELLSFIEKKEAVVKQLSGICVFEEDGISAKSLYTHLISEDDFQYFSDLENSPAFFSRFVDKKYDLRVTVVGEKFFPVRIYSQEFSESKVDFRKMEGEWAMESCDMPAHICQKIKNIMIHFKITFGAFDFAVDQQDKYWFLEVNTEGNWLWMEKSLNLEISHEISEQLSSYC
jgi:glutathione synthase/RimK-type ligase-like ATP-grasp enzyme